MMKLNEPMACFDGEYFGMPRCEIVTKADEEVVATQRKRKRPTKRKKTPKRAKKNR